MSFNPYLFFTDNCAEAFEFYGSVFGIEPQIMRNSDVPPGEEGMDGAGPDVVMHASIELNGSYLMGSDDPTGDGGPKAGFSVSYTATDAANAHQIFDGLADGGQVGMPVSETFWSPAFGMLTDKYGVSWMIDTAPAE
ncbi:MAG TPA: VOC family protein [Ilumatobacter sp.]|nr:VOC family protein [Ilumatobacter sp.]